MFSSNSVGNLVVFVIWNANYVQLSIHYCGKSFYVFFAFGVKRHLIQCLSSICNVSLTLKSFEEEGFESSTRWNCIPSWCVLICFHFGYSIKIFPSVGLILEILPPDCSGISKVKCYLVDLGNGASKQFFWSVFFSFD